MFFALQFMMEILHYEIFCSDGFFVEAIQYTEVLDWNRLYNP